MLLPRHLSPSQPPSCPECLFFAVPVVHAVGGLRDTVKPFNPFEQSGTGERPWACKCWTRVVVRHPLACPLVCYFLLTGAFDSSPLPPRVPPPRIFLSTWPLDSSPPCRHRRALCTAGWTFEFADSGRFRNALGDALYTYREHKDSFRWAAVFGLQLSQCTCSIACCEHKGSFRWGCAAWLARRKQEASAECIGAMRWLRCCRWG